MNALDYSSYRQKTGIFLCVNFNFEGIAERKFSKLAKHYNSIGHVKTYKMSYHLNLKLVIENLSTKWLRNFEFSLSRSPSYGQK